MPALEFAEIKSSVVHRQFFPDLRRTATDLQAPKAGCSDRGPAALLSRTSLVDVLNSMAGDALYSDRADRVLIARVRRFVLTQESLQLAQVPMFESHQSFK
jgi:hypothetical protein